VEEGVVRIDGGCRGTNAQGEPCQVAPKLVDENGWCVAHRPGSNEIQKRARRGAEATKKRWASKGVKASELGPLETYADAKRWLSVIARAVVSGENKLTSSDAQAGIRALQTWLQAEGERLTAEVVDDLRGEVDKLHSDVKRLSLRKVG
jgi:hypothetical protein